MWAGWYQPRRHQWLLCQIWVLFVPQHNTVLGPSCPAKPREQGCMIRQQQCMIRQCHTKRSQRGTVATLPTYENKGGGAFADGPPHIKKRLNQVCTVFPSHSNTYCSCVCAYAKIFSLLRHKTNIVILQTLYLNSIWLDEYTLQDFINWINKWNCIKIKSFFLPEFGCVQPQPILFTENHKAQL